MKVQPNNPKISYSEDVDILMIQLSSNKVEDSWDSDGMIVQVDKKGVPVVLEIFNGRNFLKHFNKDLPKKIKEEVFFAPTTSIAHRIK